MGDEGAPAWVWLPGATEPVEAARLTVADVEGSEEGAGRWQFLEAYCARPGAVSPDPVQLRLASGRKGIAIAKGDGLPGVVRDARPAGYGADRMNAAAGRALSSVELLELGVADSCGAIAVCQDVQKKLDWVPPDFGMLKDIIGLMRGDVAASQAIRTLTDVASTSVGGDRPKVTVQDGGRLYLAKMQARADVGFLPEKEFVVMTMAGLCGLRTPEVRLERVGEHGVYLIERFDRAGNPTRPERRLYASAHTVLGLDEKAKSDVRRSYIALGDEMRVWCRSSPHAEADLQELWRRMAFNALVGNADDHPRNHGLLHADGHWRLAPAFDITPLGTFNRVLSMATAPDNSSLVSVPRLLGVSGRFGLDAAEAGAWLSSTATFVASRWEAEMRKVGIGDAGIAGTTAAFSFALEVAGDQRGVERALEDVATRPKRLRRPPRVPAYRP